MVQPPTQNAVEAVGLSRSFGATRAVDGLDLVVPAGGVYGLLGPNGAGKTTTIRLLATLLRPDAGSARVLGSDVVSEAAAVRREIALTGQFASVDGDLTGAENLVLQCRLLGHTRRSARARAERLLVAFGLDDAANRLVATYSGGMQRRLDVAASVVRTPRLLFLDEPTTGLDPRSRHQVWDLVHELVGHGTTVLLTTQYLDEADQLADRIGVVARGRVVATGTPDALKRSIGGDVLEMRLSSPADAVRASAALAELTDGTPSLSETVAEDGTALLSVPLSVPVRRILDVVDDAGVAPVGFDVRRPTLDEVFLALTAEEVAA
ncbi:ATP-binding cassette domain-containing protein [Mumia sp. zg.B17]|uniref:ATP-binding cassette domain-containing protein n=1 Tax=Mumia sp. zg.B17 TaxID=2855446 RepID=UPI001C6E99A5|nr:ATP-binding cassette domain-containing protein [Mumia sp. zg.B17]MBW9207393.1 ATP-binding cassette domain-containing protein [Mumia sp. zg.B17]